MRVCLVITIIGWLKELKICIHINSQKGAQLHWLLNSNSWSVSLCWLVKIRFTFTIAIQGEKSVFRKSRDKQVIREKTQGGGVHSTELLLDDQVSQVSFKTTPFMMLLGKLHVHHYDAENWELWNPHMRYWENASACSTVSVKNIYL